jgi:hypothetical protein
LIYPSLESVTGLEGYSREALGKLKELQTIFNQSLMDEVKLWVHFDHARGKR